MDGFDVTGDSNNLNPQVNLDSVDVSGFGDARKYFILGNEDGMIQHNGWFDVTANQLRDVLTNRIGSPVMVAGAWGTVQGAPGIAGSASLETSYQVGSQIAGAAALTNRFQMDKGLDFISVLQPKAAVGSAGSAKDDGAGSNNGIRGYLQVFSVSGGTPVYTLQHSTTGTSAWSDLLTFTGASARTAEAKEASGTVRQFLRVNVTAGTATVWMGYRRL